MLLLALPILAGEQDTVLRNILAKPDQSEKLFELINYSNRNAINKPLLSLNAASKALEISFKLKDKRAEAYAYNSLGTLNYNSQNYIKAIEYFEKAVPVFVQIGEKKGEVYALKYLGFSYEKQKNFSKAIEFFEKYEQKNQSESAQEATKVKLRKVSSYEKTNQSLKSKKEIAEIEKNTSKLSPADKIEIYKELGEIFLNSSDTLSVKFLNKAISIDQKNEGIQNVNSYNTLSSIYRKQNNDEKAYEIENLKINKIKGNQKSDSIQLTIKEKIIKGEEWKELSLSYEQNGDYKMALSAFKNYMLLYDTLKQQQIADSIEKNILISNLINNEDRIKALEQSREAQAKVISFQRSISYMLGIGLLIVFCGLYFLWRISKQKEISNLKLRFQSLSNRMNPHFIYNSLNSVNLFIAQNQEKEANKFLSDFSKLMRMVMDNSSRETITLNEELNVIEKYLVLEHNRFGKKFEYKIEVSEHLELENILVPPMVIQPYIENAIWHGLRYREDNNGLVVLQIKQLDGNVICSVSDNGIGRDNSKLLKTKNQLEHQSAGMKNSLERIDILNKIYRKKLKIEISNAFQDSKNPGTLVQLLIPLEKK
jgi:hypothetical protein